MKLFSKKEVMEEHMEEGDGSDQEESGNTDVPVFNNIRHLLRVC